ncbi:hypothetical protein [Niveispirillum irakense]|uniref:M61 family metallopeptidase n=1 Tax=Niveispirillum irakense TaxID=34011 RepID=UPI001AEBCC63|nr:hypothetical protein [Niveispirillum irakense]
MMSAVLRRSLLITTLALPMLAAMPAAWAQTAGPALSLVLKPASAEATSLVPYVDVEITLTDMQTPAGEGLLRLPTVASNVVTVADAITGLTATDSQGPLSLTSHDEPEQGLTAYRIWHADRAVSGTVTVRYRAPITNAPLVRGAAPPYNLRSETGGFSAAGNNFVILPADSSRPYDISLRWDLSAQPQGAVGLSSLGIGNANLTDQPAERLSDTYYMAGTVGLYPADGQSKGYFGSWQGNPPFDGGGLLAWGDTLHAFYSRFFGDSTPGAYGVFMRPNPVNPGGGVELTNSFALTFDDKTDLDDLKITLAHEMLHTWVNSLDEPKGLLSSWFGEGLAVFYQRALPLRAGMIDEDQFLKDLNFHAGRYYTNALANTPNDEIPSRFWADTRVRVLPYDRASLYFAHVDWQLRQQSKGKRSLDDLVHLLLARRKAGEKLVQADWESLITKELGTQGLTEFQAMMKGALVLPASDAFGPQFQRTTKRLRRYELGFDPTSLTRNPRMVSGVIPGSAADRAGLRDGDQIMKPVGQDGLQGQQEGWLVLDIKRGEERLEIRYQPRGEEVDAWQWERAPAR